MAEIRKIGVFVTSHGFGHATRTCAVLNEISREQSFYFIIFSTLPNWFFLQNINCNNFDLISLQTDVGLVQDGPFLHNLDETLIEIKEFLLFKNDNFKKALFLSRENKLDLIICDISPLGLEVANRLGVPSVLIENFTWDWIYQKYYKLNIHWRGVSEKIAEVFKKTDLNIQATPFCSKNDKSIIVSPISRCIINNPEKIRSDLGCDQNSELILITTGGISKDFSLSEKLKAFKNLTFILSGNFKKISKDQNIISLPMNFPEHFPDIVNASSLVVGKVGYGTLAECYATDTPLLGCYRDDFRESVVLRQFANQKLDHWEISIKGFETMNWVSDVEKFLSEKRPKTNTPIPNGANQAASHIINFLN